MPFLCYRTNEEKRAWFILPSWLFKFFFRLIILHIHPIKTIQKQMWHFKWFGDSKFYFEGFSVALNVCPIMVLWFWHLFTIPWGFSDSSQNWTMVRRVFLSWYSRDKIWLFCNDTKLCQIFHWSCKIENKIWAITFFPMID